MAARQHRFQTPLLLVVLAMSAACCATNPPPSRPAEGSISPTTAGSSPSPWDVLRRPLITYSDGTNCATATGRHLSDSFGPGLGEGPIYGVGDTNATYQWDSVALDDNGRLPIKVLWVAEPRFEGRGLVRGLSEVVGALRFDGPDPAELRIEWTDPPSTDWREWPSMTRVSEPGCYAWQVDTEAGSDVIVFEVTGVQP